MNAEDRAAGRLGEIAAVIGCPVDEFYAPDGGTHDAGLTCELLRLWSAIKDPQARQRILESVRREAGQGHPTAEAAA